MAKIKDLLRKKKKKQKFDTEKEAYSDEEAQKEEEIDEGVSELDHHL